MLGPEDVNAFWLDEVGPQGWYATDPALDARIRDRFEGLWERARDGGLHDWLVTPRGMLAYLILTDQFPRNMFRGEARAFATDGIARAEAKRGIDRGFDMKVAEPERQFFYLPLMHSECLTDQDRCVRLMVTRMAETGAGNLLHAKAHREVIRRFGRFPYRNEALKRSYSEGERAFVKEGGYGRTLEKLRA
ncbi:DUF924 family protein [Actibacterium sp. MT2.3-13A]|uniref:DUF924 family protein n=1 Tax=Actibacterium sp. MT2.3-13A TaxID=2828332 RepID=UPI001BAC7C52|nr:DUF924 family protein [Actibacterium sp. MT2.3-13A]